MTILSCSSRAVLARSVNMAKKRDLSSQVTVAVEKLRRVLEEYRQVNYAQELPTRFKKDVVRAASSDEGGVHLEGMMRLLTNIGASNRLTGSEMKTIFDELGNKSGIIPAQSIIKII